MYAVSFTSINFRKGRKINCKCYANLLDRFEQNDRICPIRQSSSTKTIQKCKPMQLLWRNLMRWATELHSILPNFQDLASNHYFLFPNLEEMSWQIEIWHQRSSLLKQTSILSTSTLKRGQINRRKL